MTVRTLPPGPVARSTTSVEDTESVSSPRHAGRARLSNKTKKNVAAVQHSRCIGFVLVWCTITSKKMLAFVSQYIWDMS